MMRELLNAFLGKNNEAVDDSITRTRRFFDASYPGLRAERPSPIQQFVFERVASLIPRGRRDQVAVDLGCHWGRYTRYLARTYGMVWGIDVATAAVHSAPGNANIRFQVMDLEDQTAQFVFESRVDLFLAVGLFELLRDPA